MQGRRRNAQAAAACSACISLRSSFFFFQAEDGIRDLYVTGVQTCALPILTTSPTGSGTRCSPAGSPTSRPCSPGTLRSEERRVGREGKSRVLQDRLKI